MSVSARRLWMYVLVAAAVTFNADGLVAAAAASSDLELFTNAN